CSSDLVERATGRRAVRRRRGQRQEAQRQHPRTVLAIHQRHPRGEQRIAEHDVDAAGQHFVDRAQLLRHRAREPRQLEPSQLRPAQSLAAGDRAVQVGLVEVDLAGQHGHVGAELGEGVAIPGAGDDRDVVSRRDQGGDQRFGGPDVPSGRLDADEYRGHDAPPGWSIFNRYAVSSKSMVAESSETCRPRRGYESPVRRERAQRTREHVIATAATLFAEHGYAATSMRRIATEAGVGLETVTQTGRKADLLLAAFRSQLADSPDAIDLTELIGMPTPGDLETTLQAAVAALAERLRDSL